MRIGIGYDIHRLVEGRKLILGGVEIPFEKGLLGHSDADVLTHAICDAILGAAVLGDIGGHFPDNDPQYLGISSLLLLKRVAELIAPKYTIKNIDSIIIAQRPKLAPFISDMRKNIAQVLEIEIERVSVKAKTMENLGVVGEGKAIVAEAVASLA
ncbi:TPA: 2-C-methyl-D-erythritol 2,4-cyclodiphosphate synthase [Candidatus Poribacteria bacterium]|nr:2-C-methyl-D-erythritol 2,4-cyclodiphosphate synthase [Candidatus Poribacteria bacterium]